MIDSGSGINLIKQECINDDVIFDENNIIALQGIAPEPVNTLGTLTILLLGRDTRFHLVPNDIAFPQHGVLGTEFFKEHNAIINFDEKYLQYSGARMPFTETEYIKIKPRSVTPFYVFISNPELKTGYLPLLKPLDGLYLGDALVTNIDGKAHLPVFNTTDVEYDLEVPVTILEEYDTIDSLGLSNGDVTTLGLATSSTDRILKESRNNTSESVKASVCSNVSNNSTEYSEPLTSVSSYDTRELCLAPEPSRGDTDSSERQMSTGHLCLQSYSNNLSKNVRDSLVPSYKYDTFGTPNLGIGGAVTTAYGLRVPIVAPTDFCFYGSPIFFNNRGNTVDIPRYSYFGSGVALDATGLQGSQSATGRPNSLTAQIYESLNLDDESSDRVQTILQLLRTEHLNSEERDSLEQLVSQYSDRFHLPQDNLGSTNAAQHSIHTINNVPVHTKQYRFPPIHKEEIDRQVNKLLKEDIIEPSTSPYNSPVWIVPKKPDSSGNKRWRMVIDYRNLNEKTIGDAYPLPNITDILDQLGSAKYFSVLDLASGFHQIPMDPNDAPKTAFSTPYGHYQFKRMPFGLKNAPATFQRLMDNVLSGLQGIELFVYMDDIVIYARSLQEHTVKFGRLMKRLREANLKLQPDKCEFLRTEVAYLGHIISADGVKPDPGKIESIINFPQPRCPKNIKQFLGLVGYYRRFIPQFSKIAKPLTDLLKKNKIFQWKEPQGEAFDTLRKALCTEPILQYPDFSKPFVLTTDASGYAIGGVLSQGNVGKDLPIAYVSRTLSEAEQKYSTIEKECLAIVYCVTHFRPYLYGRSFTIITDHKPLVWLYSIKDPSSRLWKWRTKLSEYEYEIQYKKGSLNNNADALSRNPPSVPILMVQPIISEPADDSSDESIFSMPLTRPESVEFFPQNLAIEPPLPELSITEIDDDDNESSVADHIFEDFSESSDTETEDEIIPPQIVSAQKPNKPDKIKINYSRDELASQKDNLVIFISMNGVPFDQGAKELQSSALLPRYKTLMFERANVTSINSKTLISLPVKFNSHLLVEPDNIKNCIESLRDVLIELDIPSFSIRKTDLFDDISWSYVYKTLHEYLRELPIKITICKGLVRVPKKEERIPLIEENHSSATGGHKGVTKTYNRLRPHFYWKTMKKDIQEFIRNCRKCQIKKLTRVKTKQPMVITDTPGNAFDKISLDIMGPLPITNRGNSYILTIQDLLTKYSVAIPLIEATSLTIADAFTKNFICIYSAPKAILTDQGANFLSALMRNIIKQFNIKHYKTTAYHPQSNGSIERSHHVIMEYLKTQVKKETDWDDHLPLAMFSYNTSVHEGTKYTPFELVFGRLPRLPTSHPPLEEDIISTYPQYLTDLFNRIHDIQEEACTNLIQAKERSKEYYDRRTHTVTFKEGDYVLLLKEPRKGKFSDQYTGPYQILDVDNKSNNVTINYKSKPRVVHQDKLKLATFDPG